MPSQAGRNKGRERKPEKRPKQRGDKILLDVSDIGRPGPTPEARTGIRMCQEVMERKGASTWKRGNIAPPLSRTEEREAFTGPGKKRKNSAPPPR